MVVSGSDWLAVTESPTETAAIGHAVQGAADLGPLQGKAGGVARTASADFNPASACFSATSALARSTADTPDPSSRR